MRSSDLHGFQKSRVNDITLAISQGIREGKWLNVKYINSSNEEKSFLFATKDIDWKNKKLFGDVFNPNLKNAANPEQQKFPFDKNYQLNFNGLKHASLMPDISYQVPNSLLEKLDTLEENDDWIQFNEEHNAIFTFLEHCVQFDNDPLVKKFTMLESIDADILLKNERTELSREQVKLLSKKLLDWKNERKNKKCIIRLALNILSIRLREKNLPIVYRDILLHLSEDEQFLVVGKELQFAKAYLLSRREEDFFLSNFDANGEIFDYNPDDFINDFESHQDEYIEEIRKTLKVGESINTNPEIMQLSGNYNVHFERIKLAVANMLKNKTLTFPLRAYLGMNKPQVGRKRNVSVVTYDNKVNIDQVRVVFNSLRENITYVEGPPGTGKTQTILNVILSLFFEGRNCLVCSNNNAPIEGIIEKLVKDLPTCRGNEILFPMIRIGSSIKTDERENVLAQTILHIRNLYEKAKQKSKPIDNITKGQRERLRKNTNALSKSLEKYEERQRILKNIDILKKWQENYEGLQNFSKQLDMEIQKLQSDLEKIPILKNSDIQALCLSGVEDDSFANVLHYHSIKLLQKLQDDEYSDFVKILYEKNLDSAVKDFKNYLKEDENIERLLKVFPVWFSTNISAEKIGNAKPHFDMCIMDESGQCDIARSLIPIIRAQNLLLVGDTNQLKPVILLDEKKQRFFQKALHIKKPEIYDYVNNSILGLMQQTDSISKKILLSYHYRCARKIIEFSNSYYYDNKLHIENELKGNVALFDVRNKTGTNINSFDEEAEKILEILKRNNYKNRKIAIITPFVNQADLINQKIRDNKISNASASTIHKVQGAEYDVIILSFALSSSTNQRTFDWIKNNREITNVAVTRAKKELLVVADKQAINNLSKGGVNAVKELVTYTEHIGKNVPYTVTIPAQRKDLSNNSRYEQQFFKTLSQVLTVLNENSVSELKIRKNVPMKDVFKITDNTFKDYYERSEFDFVVWRCGYNYKKPILIIELDGDEHYVNELTKQRDNKKESLCKKQGITLFRLPNSFASHYTFIKEYITNISSGEIQQTELL